MVVHCTVVFWNSLHILYILSSSRFLYKESLKCVLTNLTVFQGWEDCIMILISSFLFLLLAFLNKKETLMLEKVVRMKKQYAGRLLFR